MPQPVGVLCDEGEWGGGLLHHRASDHQPAGAQVCGVVSFSSFDCIAMYTQRNLIESTRNQVVFTIFRLIWNQKDVCLVPNPSVHGKYNMISV